MNKITVIGAGVTGLAFSKSFGADHVKILEANSDLGGKALSYKRTTPAGTFGFDIGGHWFHHKNAPQALQLLDGLELEGHVRKAYVYLDKQFFEFPIQQSYKKHSNKDFVHRVENELTNLDKKDTSYKNYEDMLYKSYGSALYHAFFRDYNMKMYGITDLSSIHLGKYEKVRNVRLDREIKGYNGDFVYPAGDTGAKGIPLFLSKGLNIEFNSKVEQINIPNKTIVVNGQTYRWDTIVSTIPLTVLVKLIQPIDPRIYHLTRELKSSSGMILNLGVKRNAAHGDISWVYVPEMQFRFYRVGFYSNIQPLLAPEGYSSMYVECSPLFFNNQKEAHELVPKIVEDLIRIGFVQKEEDIVSKDLLYLSHNYCLADEGKTDEIRSYLERYGVYSIGRYGSWHWSSQHEDMQQAVELSNRLK